MCMFIKAYAILLGKWGLFSRQWQGFAGELIICRVRAKLIS